MKCNEMLLSRRSDEFFDDGDDAISEYLITLDEDYPGGLDFIPHIDNIWIVLHSRHNKSHRYVGWFCVAKEKEEVNGNYTYLGKFMTYKGNEYHVWRLASDGLE